MEHFNIVAALCRAAIQCPNVAVKNHIERLVKALEKSGEEGKAKNIRKILVESLDQYELAPTQVALSSEAWIGDPITPNTHPPVDKESGSYLAEIIFPDTLNIPVPIYQENLKSSIDHLLEEWRNVSLLKNAMLQPALSLLIFGQPGTGKTLLAFHISKSLHLPLVVAKLDGLISSFLGTTARNIANLFAFANKHRCILLLDEFDAIAKLRDDPNELGELKRVVNTLLQYLDKRTNHGFTIAITNHENLLDPAVWRRFDLRITIPIPDWNCRKQIVLTKAQPLKLNDAQVSFLAWLTNGGTGSDIEKLLRVLARRRALSGSTFDFMNTIRTYCTLSADQIKGARYTLITGAVEKLANVLHSKHEAGMSQEHLALLFGKSQPTISRWLKSSEFRLECKDAK